MRDIPDELLEAVRRPRAGADHLGSATDVTRRPASQQMLSRAGRATGKTTPPSRPATASATPPSGTAWSCRSPAAAADLLVTVAFPKRGIKKLDPQYAKLEKLG